MGRWTGSSPHSPPSRELLHRLWSERDPRVPVHRRPDAEGRPSVDDLAASLRETPGRRLWVVEDTVGAQGYCGLVGLDRPDTGPPELAVELRRDAWGRGYATEAGRAVLAEARAMGLHRVGAGVWDWNVASRRMLATLGFREMGAEASARPADPDENLPPRNLDLVVDL